MTLGLHPHTSSYAPETVAEVGVAGLFKLPAGEVLAREGVLFHLALLLCARHVVKRTD